MTVPPQLRKVTVRELCAALERDGFVLDRQRGSHRVYYRARDKRRVVIPYHRPGATLPIGTLSAIVRDIDWTEDDMRRLGLIK